MILPQLTGSSPNMQRVNQTQLQTVFVEGLVSASGGHMVRVREVKLELLFEM